MSLRVDDALSKIFGASRWNLSKFLCVGLACCLHHKDDIDKYLALSSQLRHSVVYRHTVFEELKENVHVRYPLEESRKTNFVIRLTGIPPHIMLMATIKKCRMTSAN